MLHSCLAKHDLYSYTLGLSLYLSLYLGVNSLRRNLPHFKLSSHNLTRALKATAILFVTFIVLPSLLGIASELCLISIRVSTHISSSNLSLYECFCWGLFLMKVSSRLIISTTFPDVDHLRPFKVYRDDLQRLNNANMLTNLDEVFSCLVLPVIKILVLLLSVSYVVASLCIPFVHNKALLFSHVFLSFISIPLMFFAGVGVKQAYIVAVQTMFDEKWLVAKELVNVGDGIVTHPVKKEAPAELSSSSLMYEKHNSTLSQSDLAQDLNTPSQVADIVTNKIDEELVTSTAPLSSLPLTHNDTLLTSTSIASESNPQPMLTESLTSAASNSNITQDSGLGLGFSL